MNNRIRKFDVTHLDGNIPHWIRDIGSRGSAPGQFKFPQAIDTDEQGNLYVADADNHRIQKFDSQGNYIMSFGTYGTETGQFLYPYGISADPVYSLIYTTDPITKKIMLFTKNGEFLTEFTKWNSNAIDAIGGIVAYGDGNFSVGIEERISITAHKKIAKFRITNLTDNDNDKIPDVLEN